MLRCDHSRYLLAWAGFVDRNNLRFSPILQDNFIEPGFRTRRVGCAGTVEAGVGKRKRDGDEMEALEAAAAAEGGTRLSGFVSAGVIQPEKAPEQQAAAAAAPAAAVAAAGGAAGAENPEDIELDEGDDDEEAGVVVEAEIQIEQQAVPDGVFGGLHGTAQQMGALDRFKKRKTDTDT